ncbi:MAG: hypothetical protein L0271_14205 [Gemmatimonadetes bacterium]|nr:hypothetical protein [Gemmatimonadota bacterium]
MVYYARVPIRKLIPTVLVRLATEEGEVALRVRWQNSSLAMQRLIQFRLRRGRPLWFQDEWGHDHCFRAERVLAALVDGRPIGGQAWRPCG